MKSINKIKNEYNNFKKRHNKTFFKIIIGFFIVFFLMGVFNVNRADANAIDWLTDKANSLKQSWNTISNTLDSLKNGSSPTSIIADSLVDTVVDYTLKSQKAFLSNLITSINDGLGDSAEAMFTVKNPLANSSNLEKFNMMKKISNRFFTLAIIFSVITILFDLAPGESEKKVKKLLIDIGIAAIFVNSISFTIPYLTDGAAAFSEYFASDMVKLGGIKEMFTLGIGNLLSSSSGSFMFLTIGVLVFLVIALFVLLGLYIFSIGVSNMFAILIIVCPLFFVLLPTNFGKEVTKKIFYFMGFLLAVGPLQALSITVGAASLSDNFTFDNLIRSCACLLFTVGAIPTFTYFLFNMAQQPKV